VKKPAIVLFIRNTTTKAKTNEES